VAGACLGQRPQGSSDCRGGGRPQRGDQPGAAADGSRLLWRVSVAGRATGQVWDVAGGESGLITDCLIASGNPADSTMATSLLERPKTILERTLEQVAFDGGFASKTNLTDARKLGITDAGVLKKRGLAIGDMTRSSWVYPVACAISARESRRADQVLETRLRPGPLHAARLCSAR
jgi:hypothetical protein